jgi:hypothetical protein
MSYTFGGATTDDIVATLNATAGADNRGGLIAGWWYPTTLTATRGLWSAGATFGAEIDTTTSELRLRTDNTTDGQWTTSGLGLVVNEWQFLAFLSATENTTVAGAWRVWRGTASQPPVIQTPSVAVSRSGNYTGNADLYAGNKGTGSLAFQGDIGWLVSILSASQPDIKQFPRLAASGVITDAEAAEVERRVVYPLWEGRPNAWEVDSPSSYILSHYPLDQLGAPGFQVSTSLTTFDLALTINGATWTENQPPVRLGRRWMETRLGSG